MLRSLRRKLIWLPLLVTLFILYQMIRILSSETNSMKSAVSTNHRDRLRCSVPVTFVIRDVEQFDHDLRATITHIRQSYSNCDILVLPDSLPYPPVEISSQNVRLVPLEYNLHLSNNHFAPTSLIKTDFVVFLSDATRIEPETIEELIKVSQSESGGLKIVAAGAGTRLGNCVSVTPDLKRWSLTFELAEMEHNCDAFPNDVVLLVPKFILANFTDPFARPMNLAFYAQSKLRNLKIWRVDDIIFKKTKNLYSDVKSRLKRGLIETTRRSDFYRKSGFKKVTYWDSKEEWFGCTRATERCFPTVIDKMPDYLYKGRWTPPCCLRALRETARHVFKTLEEAEIRYWLEGGSLLGAVRHNDIIPWDFDVDIGIYREDIIKLDKLKNSELQAIVDDKGFVWEKAREGDFYRVQFSESNRLHVDIFPFYPKNGIMTKDTWFADHRQDCEFPEQYLKPMTKIDFVGVKASAPNNVKEFLEFKFGVGVVERPEFPNPRRKTFDKEEN